MKKMNRYFFVASVLFSCFFGTTVLAQNYALETKTTQETATQSATTQKEKPKKKEDKKKSKFKEYSDIVTGTTVSHDGLFKLHYDDGAYYYEIPDSLLGKEMLVVSRYSRTPNSMDAQYGGEEINEQVWKWERNKDDILIRVPSYQMVAKENSDMYYSVRNSNLDQILASFHIVAFNKTNTSILIRVDGFFNKDVSSLSLPKSVKKRFKIGGMDPSRSYLDTIKVFPKNIEVKTVKTFFAPDIDKESGLDAVTVELNYSMILLPAKPMKVRYEDKRVGYFSQLQKDYSIDDQTAKTTEYIHRWKLIPKDKKAYLRGKLTEPVKPIIYYLDPAMPKRWRPYIKQGVEAWNVAFERAGFKNAIRCIEAPSKEEDPDWSPEDARYSVIRYFASPISNAYGPHVSDPRTGEIIESDIGWYHNVMRLLRNWYFIQTAAVNPNARHAEFKDEVMGQLIRFVATHEVGHTLGLPHNWGSSYAIPVDSLRSASYTKKMGGTAPSIMDYARFNYVAQPGDKGVLMMPGIGEYDKWSIEWGYRWFGDNLTPQQEFEKLSKMVEKKAGNPIYFFGSQSREKWDPRNQNEDLGNDPIKAGNYGIKNLKRILPNIEKWTFKDDDFMDDLDELYGALLGQWNRYIHHSLNWVGGLLTNYKTYDQKGEVYTYVDAETQKNNLAWVSEQCWTTPDWLINKDILSRIDKKVYLDKLMNYQTGTLNSLFRKDRLARIMDNQLKNGDKAYQLKNLFEDVRQDLWSEFSTGKATDMFRRNLQRKHIEILGNLFNKETNELRAYARAELKTIKDLLASSMDNIKDFDTRIHAEDITMRIDELLEKK